MQKACISCDIIQYKFTVCKFIHINLQVIHSVIDIQNGKIFFHDKRLGNAIKYAINQRIHVFIRDRLQLPSGKTIALGIIEHFIFMYNCIPKPFMFCLVITSCLHTCIYFIINIDQIRVDISMKCIIMHQRDLGDIPIEYGYICEPMIDWIIRCKRSEMN